MDNATYRSRLLAIGTPKQWDCFFEAICFCWLGNGLCRECPAYDGICTRDLRYPFCEAFAFCDHCGLDCTGDRWGAELGNWVQGMLDKCEEVGLWD